MLSLHHQEEQAEQRRYLFLRMCDVGQRTMRTHLLSVQNCSVFEKRRSVPEPTDWSSGCKPELRPMKWTTKSSTFASLKILYRPQSPAHVAASSRSTVIFMRFRGPQTLIDRLGEPHSAYSPGCEFSEGTIGSRPEVSSSSSSGLGLSSV